MLITTIPVAASNDRKILRLMLDFTYHLKAASGYEGLMIREIF
jgi:hypothetical protein